MFDNQHYHFLNNLAEFPVSKDLFLVFSVFQSILRLMSIHIETHLQDVLLQVSTLLIVSIMTI